MLRSSILRCVILFVGASSLIGGTLLSAAEVQWNQDIRQATQIAAQQKKPMMVMVSAPWCGYCQKMMKTTFQDPKIIGHINGCFVPLYVDADKNPEFVEQLQVEGLPTTLIISPEMKVLKRFSGYQTAGQLDGEIVQLCNHAQAGVPARPVSITQPVPAMFSGTCLVSLRDDGKLATGRSQWSSSYRGHQVWFASADHKRKFDARPELYWPVADGACLVSNRLDRTPRSGEPVLAMIYADRVWFFADKTRQEQFLKDPKSYLSELRAAAR